MTTKHVTLTGTVKWAHKLFTPDDTFDAEHPKYSIQLFMDDTSKEIFRNLKLKNEFKNDGDGEFVTLRRDHTPKEFDGKIIYKGGPPKVLDADGIEWPDGTAIGNGSTATVWLEAYNLGKRFPGSRITKVRIDELIPYNPDAEPQAVPKEAVPF